MRGVWCVLVAVVSAVTAYNGNYHCVGGRDPVVHLFEWKYADVERECQWLADQGYCAVQISPPTEHAIITNPWRPWWERYQPVSYLLTSRGGTEADLARTIQTCNNVGVRIYVDLIINHMTGGGSGTGTAGSAWNAGGSDSNNWGGQQYPAVPYGQNDFHPPGTNSRQCSTSNMEIQNYGDPNQVRSCRLVGLRDLAMGTQWVRDKIVDLMNRLVALGVAGFRVDAVKHMYPEDLKYVSDAVNDLDTRWFPAGLRPYVYQEVIDYGGEAIKGTEYTYIGRVKEFRYGRELSNVLWKSNGQRLAYLVNFGEGWGFLNRFDSFAFVDNHDTQRSSYLDRVTYKSARLYKMAVAFMLAWDYGHVRVMSSFQFDTHDQGPPANPDGSLQDVVCQFDGGPWVCEHRWRQIANMVRFHNVAIGSAVSNWWDNGFHAISFSRGSAAFYALNNEDSAVTRTWQTGLPAGDYCNVILCESNRPPCSGAPGCSSITVNTAGQATFTLPSNDDPQVALHV